MIMRSRLPHKIVSRGKSQGLQSMSTPDFMGGLVLEGRAGGGAGPEKNSGANSGGCQAPLYPCILRVCVELPEDGLNPGRKLIAFGCQQGAKWIEEHSRA